MKISVSNRGTGEIYAIKNTPEELAPFFARLTELQVVDVVFELNIKIESDKHVRPIAFRPADDHLTDAGVLRIYPSRFAKALLGLKLSAFNDSTETPVAVVTAAMHKLQRDVVDSNR